MAADVVFIDGKVLTMDPRLSVRQAVAVKGEGIVAVGDSREIRTHVGKRTRVVDLGGKTLLPGINDGHMHPTAWAASKPPYALSLRAPEIRAVREIRELVREKAKTLAPGEWVRGRGWNPDFLEECRLHGHVLSKRDLDDVTGDAPTVLLDWSGHNLWVNSRALTLAGITRDTPDPPGGHIAKDPATGDPTGILQEIPAFAPLMKAVPLFGAEAFQTFILHAQKELNTLGITSCTEPLGPGADRNESGLRGSGVIEAYRDLAHAGRLSARVRIPLLFGQYGGVGYRDIAEGARTYRPPRDLPGKWVRIPGIKIFADGVPPIKTAWMWEPYATGGSGSLMVPGATDAERCAELRRIIAFAHRRGWQVAAHACGDRAVSALLDGFAEAMAARPWIHPRHYIIHGDFIRSSDLGRAARYDVGVNMNPAIHPLVMDTHVSLLGARRAAREFPYRSALKAGVPLAFSSDAGVTYPDWREGVRSALQRTQRSGGNPMGPGERISRQQALLAYTLAGARQDHMDGLKGSIEVGKLADLCVLGGDILKITPEEIPEIPVLMTVVGGRVVYTAPDGGLA